MDVPEEVMRCLTELHLPTMRAQYEAVARQATAETWAYADYLLELARRECQQRRQNRIGASAEGVEAAVGEELAGAGPEASADEGGAAIAGPVERRLPGPPGECAGVRAAGIGEDALPGGGGPGVGAGGPAGVVHDVRLAGSGTVGGQAGLHAQRRCSNAWATGKR